MFNSICLRKIINIKQKSDKKGKKLDKENRHRNISMQKEDKKDWEDSKYFYNYSRN